VVRPAGCVAIVPAHGAAATIARTLTSLAIEGAILGIDDVVVVASPVDDTAERAATLGARVIRTPERLTAGAARHLGRLAAPQASYVLFVDADCAPARGCLAEMWRAMQDDDLDAVGASVVASRSSIVAWVRHVLEFKDSEPGARSSCPSFVPSATFLCRAHAYDAVGGFPDLWPGEDLVLCARLARAGYRVRRSDVAVTIHEHPPGVGRMIRHQHALGVTSALARQLEPMAGATFARHAAVVPLLFAGRFGRMVAWVSRKGAGTIVATALCLPIYLGGLVAWCIGFYGGARRLQA
jgi:cellulose synthase/poly-beta-1,6-N-acetylglucosamine synthase-like glycosyltransferase